MMTDKKLGVFCDKCKKIVILEEGDHVLKLINLECIATYFENEKSKLKTELTLCPECSKKFTSWLNQTEEG